MRRPYPSENRIYVYGELYDIPRLLDVFQTYRVDAIIHIAAQSSPTVSLEVPLQTIHTNIDGTASLLEAARLSGIRRVVLYSSDAACGMSRTVWSAAGIRRWRWCTSTTRYTAPARR